MPHQFDWSSLVPFVLMTGQQQPRFSAQRIIEAVIIGAISAGTAMYTTTKVLEEQIKTLRTDVQKVEVSLQRIERDFYVPNIGVPSSNKGKQ